ncbi:MAG TPA: hypothetical protein VGG85_08075 [Terracidiphilus sp.]|jgi:hypothetical protein
MKGTTRGLIATVTLLLATYAGAQTITPVAVSPADTAAVAGATSTAKRVFPALTPAGASYKEAAALKGPPLVPFTNTLNNRYPGDLTYQGGAYMQSAQSHAIYLFDTIVQGAPGCTPYNIVACWSTPETFLTNYGKSDFIHITDQYVQSNANGRYTVGGNGGVYYPAGAPHILTDLDIQAIVHLAATFYGYPSGYNGVFHVFLPPGTDECFDSTHTVCYSPDNPSTFDFCAYHSSVTFSDIGETIYSVEPSQNVGGCSVPPGSPNGQLADSTNNVLSHEMTELITDPDGNAWWNPSDVGLGGEEIGDECEFVVYTSTGEYFNPSVFKMNGVRYAIQPEYSNIGHACRVTMND